MKWAKEHDIMLCREVLIVHPHQYRPKSSERGNAGRTIANDLDAVQEIRFSVPQKAVRDKLSFWLNVLLEMIIKKDKLVACISLDESEVDEALCTII